MSLSEAFARVDAPAMFNRLFKGGFSADPQSYLDAQGVIGRVDVVHGVMTANELTADAANEARAPRLHLASRRAARAERRANRAL